MVFGLSKGKQSHRSACLELRKGLAVHVSGLKCFVAFGPRRLRFWGVESNHRKIFTSRSVGWKNHCGVMEVSLFHGPMEECV